MIYTDDNMPSKNEALDSLFDVEEKPQPEYDKYSDDHRKLADSKAVQKWLAQDGYEYVKELEL